MFKISDNRKIVLENGLIEVVRFPRGWKDYTNQLWNLNREQLISMVRVMDPSFKDVRLYKSKPLEEASPGVVELPRYYAIGINKRDEWFTEDGILVGIELPSDIIERVEQKLAVDPFVAAFRKNWLSVLSSSMVISVVAGLLSSELILPNAGTLTILIAMAITWMKIGLPYCGLILSFNTLVNYLRCAKLSKALDTTENAKSYSQPLPSSELI